MGRSYEKVLKTFSKKDREYIEKRGQEKVQEYLTLQELRKAQELTQAALATTLNINQDGVSKLEKRSDMLLSTLRSYIEAMGGELNLSVSFPDHKTVSLNGIGQSQE